MRNALAASAGTLGMASEPSRLQQELGELYEFARFFRDDLRCSNALFLDGGVAPGLYAPELGRNDPPAHGGYGPIIAVVDQIERAKWITKCFLSGGGGGGGFGRGGGPGGGAGGLRILGIDICTSEDVVRSPSRSTVRTLSRLIKIGVGGLSGPACRPQSDQIAIAFLFPSKVSEQ